MTIQSDAHKLSPERMSRRALIYLRQSSPHQVIHHRESQKLQYALAQKAQTLGFADAEIIDEDLGVSASSVATRRHGFERVLSQVAMGVVGLVLSREVSRLLRTDKDWCQLVEVCRLFDTLIGDEDGLYDLNNTNDQLILGVKGTISVVELRTLQLRLRDGITAKAARGELYQGLLPVGYVLQATGQLVKDPNARVQAAMEQIFLRFSQTWSIRQTFQWFRDHDFEVPVRAGRNELRWKVPSHEYIAGVLHNPVYAGAYAHGRNQSETVWQEGQLIKRRRVKALDDWHVLLREHHDGYISWAEFETNLQRIAKNVARRKLTDSETAVRSGKALLAGLLRCGRCGRRLGVRYTGGPRHGCPQYWCQGDYKAGGERCQWIGGALLERQFEQQLLEVLAPLGVQASLHAAAGIDREYAAQRELLAHQLQQLAYEQQRAFEQYNAVDARNRLVADELERRWNDKLQEQQRLEARLRDLDNEQRPLAQEQRQRIVELGEQFEQVWRSTHCPADVRKKIVRTVIEEAVVTRDDSTGSVRMVIHWKGGAHTATEIPGDRRHARATSLEAIDILRKMAEQHYGDEDIARVLNQQGHHTGQGNHWDVSRVASFRQKHAIPGRRRTQPRPGLISMNAAVELTGTSDRTILNLIRRGVVRAEQAVAHAPWLIHEEDLHSDRVRQLLEGLRSTGRLPLVGGPANKQRNFFE
jgi:DNA invertase Pin-like site-specific DNA recombinase